MIIEQALHEINYDISIDSSIYYNNKGKLVPRVTDILSSSMHGDALLLWANSLGFKKIRYRERLAYAANIGSKTHEAIDKYIKSNIKSDNIGFLGFLLWFDNLKRNNIVKIISNEEKLICDYFGGTYDLLLQINNKVFLVDFKTSNRVTSKYFMQLAAYRYMLYNVKNINIDGCIILQLNKESPEYDEYVLDFSNLEHYNFIEYCARAFLSLVYSYYNTLYVESLFNKIF